MNPFFSLFLRLFISFLAAMGLIRFLDLENGPGVLLGMTLLGVILSYAANFLMPLGAKPAAADPAPKGEGAREVSQP